MSATSPPPDAIGLVLAQVGECEERLRQLLAAGWRNAGDDLIEIAAGAETLASLGLGEVAARLQAVATAREPGDGVRAAAVALLATRLLRLRLTPDEGPPATWKPFAPATARRPAASRLLPLCRITLEGGEVWSCLELRSGFPTAWLLVEPTELPALDAEAGASAATTMPWLTRALSVRLRWRRRLPLGDTGDVDLCALEDAAWAKPFGPVDHPLGTLLTALAAGRTAEGLWLTSPRLRLVPCTPETAAHGPWPDAAIPALLAGAPPPAETWALVWAAGGDAPVALLTTGTEPARRWLGLVKTEARPAPRLIHLVPGLPREVIATA